MMAYRSCTTIQTAYTAVYPKLRHVADPRINGRLGNDGGGDAAATVGGSGVDRSTTAAFLWLTE